MTGISRSPFRAGPTREHVVLKLSRALHPVQDRRVIAVEDPPDLAGRHTPAV